MEIFKNLNKTIVLYTTIALAGFVYISKRLFSKKVNKKFYNKEKKKTLRRFNIFFTSIYKNIEVRNNNKDTTTGTIGKLKAFCEKIYDEKNKDEHENIKEIKNRKDQIFYYLLQKVSKMIIQNQKNE
jgi:hypothetical protein